MPNTKVTYMYRDASNWKFWGEFVVEGYFNPESVEHYLFDGEFFIPHEVGLDHLLDEPMNEDDHYLHTFQGVKETTAKTAICTAEELIKRFKAAFEKGWFSSF